jgi:hypothetical protein
MLLLVFTSKESVEGCLPTEGDNWLLIAFGFYFNSWIYCSDLAEFVFVLKENSCKKYREQGVDFDSSFDTCCRIIDWRNKEKHVTHVFSFLWDFIFTNPRLKKGCRNTNFYNNK